jgi:hypothetical protein
MVFMGVVFIFFDWQEVMPLAAGDGFSSARRGHGTQFSLSGIKTQPFFNPG